MTDSQMSLFHMEPAPQHLRMPRARARDADPVTSHEAAETEGLGEQARTVLEAVTRWPGRTAVELAELIAFTRKPRQTAEQWRHPVSRRTADLAGKGLIRRGEIRECRLKMRRMVTWWPVP